MMGLGRSCQLVGKQARCAFVAEFLLQSCYRLNIFEFIFYKVKECELKNLDLQVAGFKLIVIFINVTYSLRCNIKYVFMTIA